MEQDFALVVQNAELLSSMGMIALDRTVYRCADSPGIVVTDTDLNGLGTISIEAEALPTGDLETIELTEQEPGIFVATVPLQEGSAVSGNGALETTGATSIRVEYLDANDGTGTPATHQAESTLDCQVPAILGIEVLNVTYESATIRFTTDEPVTALLEYGTDCAQPTNQESQRTLATEHLFELRGLAPCTWYSFRGVVTDGAGNEILAQLGDSCYAFVTGALSTAC